MLRKDYFRTFRAGACISLLLLTVFPEKLSAWLLSNSGTRVTVVKGYQTIGGRSLAIDSSGNSYLGGSFRGELTFGTGTSSDNVSSAGADDLFLAKHDKSGNLVWRRTFGSSAGPDYGRSVVVDSAGFVYFAGYLGGVVDFDPGAGTVNLPSGGFVVKLDQAGGLVWARGLPSVADDLVVMGSDGVVVTGQFSGTKDFDPGSGVNNLTSAGSNDIFIVVLDTDGTFVRAQRLGGSGDDWSPSVAVDGQQNLLLAGSFSGVNDFDPGMGTFTMTSSGAYDVYVMKLGPSGDFVWSKRVGGLGDDFGMSIAADNSNNVAISGIFAGSVDFDPGSGTYMIEPSVVGDTGDAFVLKLNSSGEFEWARSYGDRGYDYGRSVAFDREGGVFLAGDISNKADFDGSGANSPVVSNGGGDAFIVKLRATGGYEWSSFVGGQQADYGFSLAPTALGGALLAGTFLGEADFEIGNEVFKVTSGAFGDSFLLEFDNHGLTSPSTTTTSLFGVQTPIVSQDTSNTRPSMTSTGSTNSSKPRSTLMIKVKKSMTTEALLKRAGVRITKGSKIVAQSRTVKNCKMVRGTRVVALKQGMCTIRFRVTPPETNRNPRPKTVVRTVKITISR